MRGVCATLLLPAVLCMAESKGTTKDEIAIRKVLAGSTEAFNRHEGKLTPDGYSNDFDAVIATCLARF